MRDFGAFVDLGGADGLVHISELSWHRIDHPREVVRLGDEIEVYVLGVDQESGRISLSRKKLLENPWDTVADRYVQNQLVEGKITRILDYGAFAEIEPGVEGLLHVSQLSRNTVEDPRSVVKEGEVHLLRVVSIDQKRQRIGLSLKAVTPTEQIEWMAEKELAEDLRREEEEAAIAARGATQAADLPEETGVIEATDEASEGVEEVAVAIVVEAETAEQEAEEASMPEVIDEVAEQTEPATEETEPAMVVADEATEVVEDAVDEVLEDDFEEPVEEVAEAEAIEAAEETIDVGEEAAAPEAIAENVDEVGSASEPADEEPEAEANDEVADEESKVSSVE
jgi:ribosomal protein S1